MPPTKTNLHDALATITAPWRPKTIAAVGDHAVKLARLDGPFVWHQHDDADEMFLGVTGRFRIEFRDGAVEIGPGDAIVVPAGVEHRPVADEEASALLFERAGLRNTGDVEHPTLTAPDEPSP